MYTSRGVSALLNLILQRSAYTLDVLQLQQGVFLHSMWEGAVFWSGLLTSLEMQLNALELFQERWEVFGLVGVASGQFRKLAGVNLELERLRIVLLTQAAWHFVIVLEDKGVWVAWVFTNLVQQAKLCQRLAKRLLVTRCEDVTGAWNKVAVLEIVLGCVVWRPFCRCIT